MNYTQRFEVIKSLKQVTNVIPQESLDYTDNLCKLKPSFVVHGDDWKEGIQYDTRRQVIETISEWGGELIEIPYTAGISSSSLINAKKQLGTTPQIRLATLRRLLRAKPLIRFLDIHNGLSGLIVENAEFQEGIVRKDFDGMWASSHKR